MMRAMTCSVVSDVVTATTGNTGTCTSTLFFLNLSSEPSCQTEQRNVSPVWSRSHKNAERVLGQAQLDTSGLRGGRRRLWPLLSSSFQWNIVQAGSQDRVCVCVSLPRPKYLP